MTDELPPLTADQHAVLQMAYDQFRDRGTWASFGELDRPLRRHGLKPDKIIETIPDDLLLPFQAGRRQPIARDELQLSLRGIAACSGGQEDIDLFLHLIPWLAERELNFKPIGDGTQEYVQVAANEIKTFLELPDDSTGAIARLRRIIGLQRWGWSGGEFAGGDWYVQVTRDISRFAEVSTLDEYLEIMAKWEEEGKRPYVQIADDFYGTVPGISGVDHGVGPMVDTYISVNVVSDLETAAERSVWNCDKLMGLVRELNDSYASGNVYAAHALLRAILDHVPPVLNSTDFAAIVNNYSWAQTDRKYMRRLLEFRNQADDALHRQISRKPDVLSLDDMPSRTGVRRLLQECASNL